MNEVEIIAYATGAVAGLAGIGLGQLFYFFVDRYNLRGFYIDW